MNSLRQRWQAMSLRERLLLSICASLLMLYPAYSLFWQPWVQRENQWLRTITRERQTIDWMLQHAPAVAQARQLPAGERDVSLPMLVSQRASGYGLAIVRLQPQGDQVAVTLGRSDFNSLIGWLAELEQQHGIRPSALEVSAVAHSPGSVEVSKLVLERADES
ncbi:MULTISPECIES: type II secretion system protein GspM [unclassified Brenneria]|uniref:type II secretion system protein GspM n=1 Tax=unclassified Brenneria TaxID=2634434 RepID=UPI001556E287|nr:type II secretion system protein M [Brenneria sp. hezel4-2-4]MEE3652611.1 type II secretion system protein M [Brenneria sp. HEZEL_4_2_4]NPD02569.1 type II secretion system protein M [Brenneria sp. hezel4-2-4]